MGFFSRLFGGSNKAEPIANLPGPGTYSLDIVGEYKYQSALEKICRGRTEGGHGKIIQATLIHEDDNPYDNKAIRVDVDGMTVGYLSRENAGEYRKRLKEAGHPGITATCSAIIVGGWGRGSGDKGHFGVKLDLPMVEERLSDWKETSNATEFSFLVDRPNTQELTQVEIGDYVNLWAPADAPTNIFIYRRDTGGGQGKLDLVPKTYARLITNHRALQLPIETEVIDRTASTCTIRCRLVSAEEVNRKRDNEQRKLRAELTKPYRPKKPVEFSVDAKSYTFNVGERLQLVRIPSIDECIDDIHGAVLIFSSLDGKRTVEKRDETAVKIKIVRLTQTFNDLSIQVISKSGEKPWYKSEHKLQVVPITA